MRFTKLWVSLKGADSNPRLPPGLFARMNPKSTWITRPWASNKIFPLCLKRSDEGGVQQEGGHIGEGNGGVRDTEAYYNIFQEVNFQKVD